MPRGFQVAPGMHQAAPSVLGTMPSGKNVLSKIARPQLQRDFVFSVVAKKRKSLPPPPSETDRKAVGINTERFWQKNI